MPKVAVLDIVKRNNHGELIATANGIEAIVRQNNKTKIVGVGDSILARVEKHGKIYLAKVMKSIGKKKTDIFGIFQPMKNQKQLLGYIQPVARSQKEFFVVENKLNAKQNDLVSATIKDNKTNLTSINKIHCNINNEKSYSLIALHQHNVPCQFPNQVLAEANKIKNKKPNFENWSDIPFVTIDPFDAKDHDDAIFATTIKNNVEIIVAIADVAFYVSQNSAIDVEAFKRSNSVYLPDCVVPMLPDILSTNLCSLQKNKLRPAIAVKINFDGTGKMLRYSFHRVLIKVVDNFSYEQAQKLLEKKADKNINNLKKAFDVLQIEAAARSPLDLLVNEYKIALDENNKVQDIFLPPQLTTHKIVETFMIAANVAAAKILEKQNSKNKIYRIHDSPSPTKCEELRTILKTISLSLAKGQLKSHHFNGILANVKNTKHWQLINQTILRTQSQAQYSPHNIGHFGLNLTHYTHFTSPIRRYSDLLIHRELIAIHNWDSENKKINEVDKICLQLSQNERRAMLVERQTNDRFIAKHLSEKIGIEFVATINGTTNAGLFVTLEQNGADGFIPMEMLQDDYYIYVESQKCVYGRNTKLGFQMGDKINVQLIETNPLAGEIICAIISSGKKMNVKLPAKNLRKQKYRRRR